MDKQVPSSSSKDGAKTKEQLSRLYSRMVEDGLLVNVTNFARAAKDELGLKLSRTESLKLLTGLESYGRNAAAPSGPRVRRWNPYRVGRVGHLQADLLDVRNYAPPRNRNTRYVMVCVDLLSSYWICQPMARKSQAACVAALEAIIAGARLPIVELQFDGELGIRSRGVESLLRRHGIALASPRACQKAERALRTIRRLIVRHMAETGTRQYLDFLAKAVRSWNNEHVLRGTAGLTPAAVIAEPWLLAASGMHECRFHDPLKHDPDPSLKVLCRVRFWRKALAKPGVSFTKESRLEGGWSSEEAVISAISLHQRYPTYELAQPLDRGFRLVTHSILSHHLRKTCTC